MRCQGRGNPLPRQVTNLRKIRLETSRFTAAMFGNWRLNAFSLGKRVFSLGCVTDPSALPVILFSTCNGGGAALPHLSQDAPYKIDLKSRERSQTAVLPTHTNASKGLTEYIPPCPFLAMGFTVSYPGVAPPSCGQLQIQASNKSYQLPLSPVLSEKA